MGGFETEVLTQPGNLTELTKLAVQLSALSVAGFEPGHEARYGSEHLVAAIRESGDFRRVVGLNDPEEMTARGSDPGCDLSRCSRDRDGFGSEYLDLLVAVRTVHTGILISRSGRVRNIGLRGRARATDRQGGTSLAHRPGRQGRGAGRRRAKPRWGGASPLGQRQGLARVGVLRAHGLSSAGATFPRRYGWAKILREIRTKGVRDSYVYPYEDTHRIHCSDGSFSRLGGGVDSQPPHGTSCPRRTSCDGSDWRVVVYAWVVLDDNGVARSFVRPGVPDTTKRGDGEVTTTETAAR